MRSNEEGLFPALEAALKASGEPMDCQALFDMPEIRKHAASANRISDYLGGPVEKGPGRSSPSTQERQLARPLDVCLERRPRPQAP